MAPLLFTCPTTKLNVQYWLDDEEEVPNSEYEAIKCAACAKPHLINRKTGKLLGAESDGE
jgi:hypothetical protein